MRIKEEFSFEKDDLHIRDLGYVTMPYLNGIVGRGAYFLNRLPTTIKVCKLKNGEHLPLDWYSIDSAFTKNGISKMELDVVLSKKHKLKITDDSNAST